MYYETAYKKRNWNESFKGTFHIWKLIGCNCKHMSRCRLTSKFYCIIINNLWLETEYSNLSSGSIVDQLTSIVSFLCILSKALGKMKLFRRTRSTRYITFFLHKTTWWWRNDSMLMKLSNSTKSHLQ